MRTEIETATLTTLHRFNKRIVMMPAIHPVERSVMHALQSQFKTDIAVTGIALHQVEHRVRHAVGARADRQADNLGMLQRLVVKPLQFGGQRIGVRGGLKISDELLCPVALRQDGYATLDLFLDR